MRALIAGAGDLPSAVAAAADTPPLVAVVEGFAPNNLTADLTFRIETIGSVIQDLQVRGVTEVCFCGQIQRPLIDVSAIDAATMQLLPLIMEALQAGDDGALRAVVGLFEHAGFAVRAAHEIAPALLPPAGVLTDTQPYEEAASDAQQGDLVSQTQGAEDLGQACVIRGGAVVAREDDRGTDVMLAGLSEPEPGDALDQLGDLLGAAADWLSNPPRSGLLYKAPKPGQERRVDLPVIGPDTVQAVAAAGLAGIVVEAGGVMVLHQDKVLRACNEAGLFLWVRAP